MQAIVQPPNNTNNVIFRIVGDNSSVAAVYAVLIANCTAANTSGAITAFTPSTSTYPLPEQVIQWYRASTFALSLDIYNNSASLLANMPASDSSPALPLSADTPLPSGLNTTFLECVNATVGASVPLVDLPSKPNHLGAEIATPIIVGPFVCIAGYYACRWCFRRVKGWLNSR